MNATVTPPADVCLYELALQNGHSASPYVWRIRFALAHKGLRFESKYLGFTDIALRFGGRFKTVPIIEHGGTSMAESWDIAGYLDPAFPTTPPLFSSPAEFALARLTDEWFTSEVLRRMFHIYLKDVHDAARPEDQGYFRQSREQMLRGRTLEDFTAARESQLPALRDALRPLRSHLQRFPFLGGSTAGFADYIVLGAFIWVSSVGTLPPLRADDHVLRDYVERGFDLYDGLARDPRLKSLFE